MHLPHISQYTIQNRTAHVDISGLNGALWDVKQVHCVFCEFALLTRLSDTGRIYAQSIFISVVFAIWD